MWSHQILQKILHWNSFYLLAMSTLFDAALLYTHSILKPNS